MANIISVAAVKADSWVQQNVDNDMIAPIIPDVELMKLEPIIGAALYTEIIGEIVTDNVSTANAALLVYIKPMLVKYILEELGFALNNQITATGVISKDNQNGASLTRDALFRTMKKFQSNAEFYKNRLIQYMRDNDFTVYTQKTFTTSIYFNGKNNNRRNNSSKG